MVGKWYLPSIRLTLFQAYFVFVSSLCKNETFPILPLVIAIFISRFLPDEPWFSHSIVTICLADYMPSLGCFTRSWGTAAMSGLVSQPLNLYLFRAVPPLPEPVATLNTTHSSRRSQLSALFWLSRHEKIAESLVVLISLNWLRNDIYPVYVYPFFGLG